MTEFAIEAVGLRKSFKGHEALSGLNLTVPQGSIFGFLGRNGAGKTTTISPFQADYPRGIRPMQATPGSSSPLFPVNSSFFPLALLTLRVLHELQFSLCLGCMRLDRQHVFTPCDVLQQRGAGRCMMKPIGIP
jgi:ABC-type taurine transport system ATPase subunit